MNIVTRQKTKHAFSLIEVMVALMVVSVGVLAILGLFPMGLDQGARTMAASQAALFADEVFCGLRAVAEDDWNSLTQNLELSVPMAEDWDDCDDEYLGVHADNMVHTNFYRLHDNTNIVNHVLRYRLQLTNQNVNLMAAALWIWNGEYGSLNNDYALYYTEFFNTRGLP